MIAKSSIVFWIWLAGMAFSTLAQAQTDIYVRGSGKRFPVAVPQLCLEMGEGTANREIPRVLGRDLELSGYFEVLEENSYIEAPGRCSGPEGIVYSDWSVIKAEGVVRGSVSAEGMGLRVKLFLHDVQRQKVVLGKEYTGDSSQVAMIAHKFANEILRFFTGESGVFGTQIAFSSKTGRFKDIFIMDMDGSNLRQLTNEKSLAMSAAWSPNGSKLLYTSYRSRVPDIFEVDISSRIVRQITRSPELEVGGRYSPDGSGIATSISDGRDSDIVFMNLDGRIASRLTRSNGAIDVSPVFSPDGRQIAFCSDRAGSPQIYVMNSDGSAARRVSFVTSNYCTSPAWSPKGSKLAFVCRADSGFHLFTAGLDGSNPLQLTSAGSNEDPDWSPDGRYIVFATTFWRRGIPSIALIRSDGSGLNQLTNGRGGDFDPVWGPMLW